MLLLARLLLVDMTSNQTLGVLLSSDRKTIEALFMLDFAPQSLLADSGGNHPLLPVKSIPETK
jgi:hypothetical protein